MRVATAAWLRCPLPKCNSPLEFSLATTRPSSEAAIRAGEVQDGSLRCAGCAAEYPILAGVAILVPDVGQYLLEHVKGISRFVPDARVPAIYRHDFARARREIETGHIEDDLEAERVNALYLMTHYLSAAGNWWGPDPLIGELVRVHWNRGPFARLREMVPAGRSLIELGCGVGGLLPALASRLSGYLGVDSSFASVAHARKLALHPNLKHSLKIPADLLQGGVSREIPLPVGPALKIPADFVVGDLEHPPLQPGIWDTCAALTAIDMMHEPRDLPQLQHTLLKKHGLAYQSGPYIWHEAIARRLRKILPKQVTDSAACAEWLYTQAGFEITRREDHVPWLFFKHFRQLEIYSVHLFEAHKT